MGGVAGGGRAAVRRWAMRVRAATLAATVAVALAACGSSSAASADRQLVVFAAASLTGAFTDVADAFERAHGGAAVTLSFAGSSSLREQVLAGAPADVFASADSANMAQVVEAGAATGERLFAANGLRIVVPRGNPAGITGPADFADPDLLIGLCAPQVPCGDLARRALATAGVEPAPDTEEPDVRALLTKVRAGELDAGIVYRTDVAAAGEEVEGVALPAGTDLRTPYPIAVLSAARDPVLAGAFVEFVVSEEAQAILRRHGFDPPPAPPVSLASPGTAR